MSATDANWIDYKPGDPIPKGRMRLRLRNGRRSRGYVDASKWRWTELGETTIAAYLHEKAPEETEAERLARCAPELVEALRFYADPISYAVTQAREPRSAAHGDGGKRARQALKDAGIEP